MQNFNIKSNVFLAVLSLLAMFSLLAVENHKEPVKEKWYREKILAARRMMLAEKRIREFRLEKGIFVDKINDPNETALIGQEFTLITTDRGDLAAKLSTTNPNFAAVIVDLLKKAGLRQGDNVAIAMTGSFPSLNIAVLAAAEVLKLTPIIITSVGASNWGANDPNFTWLDMEKILAESNILGYRSVAASIGGGGDIGRGLSPAGRKLIIESIKRNGLIFIHEKKLEDSIKKRMAIYEESSNGHPIKVYINVGGGIASLGYTVNGKLIPGGLNKRLPMQNYPVRGVIIKMAQRNIPIIHLLNIRALCKKYGLPVNPIPLPEPGKGRVFVCTRYNIIITWITTLFLIAAIFWIAYIDRKNHQLGADIVPHVHKQDTEVLL